MSTKPRPHPRGVQYRKKKPRSIQVGARGAVEKTARGVERSRRTTTTRRAVGRIVDDFDEAFDDDDEDYGAVCCGHREAERRASRSPVGEVARALESNIALFLILSLTFFDITKMALDMIYKLKLEEDSNWELVGYLTSAVFAVEFFFHLYCHARLQREALLRDTGESDRFCCRDVGRHVLHVRCGGWCGWCFGCRGVKSGRALRLITTTTIIRLLRAARAARALNRKKPLGTYDP